MRVIVNYSEVKPSTGEFARPDNGGYVIKIVSVEDVPLNATTQKGDYLLINYDIAQGDFAGYYQGQNDKFGGPWVARFTKSYKEKALGMFKHFINCVEESNRGFTWNWNEHDLVGCVVGVTLQEEEYERKDGNIGVSLKVKEIKTVQQILDGDFKIPETKRLNKANTTAVVTPVFHPIDDFDDMPF